MIPAHSVVFGTGHRPDKIGAQEREVREHIRALLNKYQPSVVISGLAQGFDQWLADEALKMYFPVVAAVPFLGQDGRWPKDARLAYHALVDRCTKVEILRTERPISHAQAAMWLDERNHWMVDNAQAGIACYNGDPSGGTANCVRYARVRKKPLIEFDPYSLIKVTA